MDLNQVIKRALELFPERNESRHIEIKFSRAFHGYNATCTYNIHKITFRVSYLWKDVNEEIFLGLIQELFNKIYKKKKNSYNIDLYNDFIKKSISYSKVENIDNELKEIFDRVNNEYFNGMIDTPNLRWASASLSKMGSYDFMTNTISINIILKDEKDLIDYVMYHEILHKKMLYQQKNNNKIYHGSEFKKKEKEFKIKDIEKRLESFLRKKKVKKLFKFF